MNVICRRFIYALVVVVIVVVVVASLVNELFEIQFGKTALIMASEFGKLSCVQALVDKGAKVDSESRVS